MMMHWGEGYGWMGAGWIFMALFWILVIVGIVSLIRTFGMGLDKPGDPQTKTPLQILQERYARGEIGREEYEQKRADLEK